MNFFIMGFLKCFPLERSGCPPLEHPVILCWFVYYFVMMGMCHAQILSQSCFFVVTLIFYFQAQIRPPSSVHGSRPQRTNQPTRANLAPFLAHRAFILRHSLRYFPRVAVVWFVIFGLFMIFASTDCEAGAGERAIWRKIGISSLPTRGCVGLV